MVTHINEYAEIYLYFSIAILFFTSNVIEQPLEIQRELVVLRSEWKRRFLFDLSMLTIIHIFEEVITAERFRSKTHYAGMISW